MALLKNETKHHTYADYLNWPKGQSGELVNGVAYVSDSPVPESPHQEIVSGLYRQVADVLNGEACHVYRAPFDVRLPKSTEPDEQVDTVLRPDVLIVCDLNKLDARGMRGAPDWVAEVASPSTERYDQVVKVSAYERAGVREVWLIHPTDHALTIYRLEAGRYGRPTLLELKGKTQLTAVQGAMIDWGLALAKAE